MSRRIDSSAYPTGFAVRRASATGLGLVLALAATSAPAVAQTASQITPPSFAPPQQMQGNGFVIPEGNASTVPAGAERLSVKVRRVAVEGGLPDLAETTAALAAGLSGRRVTAAEIFAAARKLELAYAQAGFALVRVILPAQKLRDGGDVRLVVVDGLIERIDVSALPPAIRDRVAAMLAPLVGERGLSFGAIERKLLLAGDTPGTILRSVLEPGKGRGASVLVVEARYKAVTGFTGVDNTLSKSLGTYTGSVGFEFNSPTGQGESLYMRAFGLPTTGGSTAFIGAEPRNRALAAGLTLPLGTDGFILGFEATDARTAARTARGSLGFDSDFSRYSVRGSYPVIRSRDFTWNTGAQFDAQEDRVGIRVPVTEPFSLDRLRILRASTDVLWYLPEDDAGWGLPPGGVVTGRLIGSFGVDALGARQAPPTGSRFEPLSRQGAKPEFQKLEAFLTYVQPLAEHLTFAASGHGQTSFNQALLRSEQIGLANTTGLSAFESGLFQGDEGFVARGELQVPFVVSMSLPFALPSIPAQEGSVPPSQDETPVAVQVSPYGFGAFGLVRQQRPTALERPVVRGVAYGAGLRFSAAPGAGFSNTSATIEYGRADRSGRQPSDHRLTFSIALQF